MIDPNNITNYNRTQAELEEFLLFAIVVAGKNSKVQAQKLNEYLNISTRADNTPFKAIQNDCHYGTLDTYLRSVKLGQYNRLIKTFHQVMIQNQVKPLNDWGFSDLVQIDGIGPKTANFFLLHSQEDYNEAVLDTHILKWIRSLGYDKAPISTPNDPKKYRMWNMTFKHLAKTLYPHLTLAEADLKIWTQYNKS